MLCSWLLHLRGCLHTVLIVSFLSTASTFYMYCNLMGSSRKSDSMQSLLNHWHYIRQKKKKNVLKKATSNINFVKPRDAKFVNTHPKIRKHDYPLLTSIYSPLISTQTKYSNKSTSSCIKMFPFTSRGATSNFYSSTNTCK